MNVLFVDQFGDLGGAQQCLLDLIPATLQRGWKALAAVPGEGPLADRLEACGVLVTRIETPRYSHGRKSLRDTARFALETPRFARQLSKLCRLQHIDLLYVNGPRMLPAAALCTKSVPVLFHAHSVPAGLSRQLVRFSAAHCNATVVAVSRFVAEHLQDGRGVNVVPNGVKDLHIPHTTNRVPRVGVIGRLAPEKGQLLFVEAARRIPNCSFVICGAPLLSQSSYAERVRATSAGLPIEFLGWQDDVAAVLSSLDLLVVPSAAQEGFCRTVIEAFSARVPVVAFPSGGIPELVKDGQTGFLVSSQSAQALAERIVAVLQDAAGRERVTTNARTLWETHYTLTHYTKRIIELMDRASQR